MSRTLKGCAIGCGGLALLGMVALIGAAGWLRGTLLRPKPPDPAIAARTALRPTFTLRDGRVYRAGTAVTASVEPGRAAVLLTALHLFGPNGGLAAETPPAKLDALVSKIELAPFGERRVIAVARGALRTSGPTLTNDLDDVSNDVAAFALEPGSAASPLQLAAEDPALGEWVWLVGDIYNHRPQAQRLFPGRVVRVSGRGLRVTFRQPFPVRAFSGAPVVNVHGELAGILIGGDGKRLGICNPASSIRRRLEEAGVGR
jgi:hypothetical protein